MVWKSAPLNARSAEIKRDGSSKPDLTYPGPRILSVGLKGGGYLGIGTTRYLLKSHDRLGFDIFLTPRKYGIGFHTTHQPQLRPNPYAFLGGRSALRPCGVAVMPH
jgi:hypothetical protein